VRPTKPFDLLDDEVYSKVVELDHVTCDVIYYNVYEGVRCSEAPLTWLSLKHSTSFEDEDETSL
jgi:hypothetical protein